MNTGRFEGVWGAGTIGTEDASGRGAEGAEVIEAVLSWRDSRGDNVLARKEVAAGASLSLGDDADLMVPGEVLGMERFEVLHFDGARAVVSVPAGGRLRVDGWARDERAIDVTAGHAVEVHVGAFVVRLSRVRAGVKPAAVAPLENLKRGGAGVLFASALAHAAAFAVIAYVSPALGATEDDTYDPDRIMLMQKLLNASAERETEQLQEQPTDGATNVGGETASKPAAGREGEAGKDTPNKDGKWAAKGTARPEDATLARKEELTAAANFGLIGMLATMNQSDPNAPTVPWGTTLNGADDVNKIGHLFGSTLDDAMGTGGWGLSGPGEGGGGFSNSIGIGDGFGVLGGTGSCVGGGKCTGIGHGGDKIGGTHTSKFKGPRYGTPQANGHLPAEVIQRIVRQNDGRFRFCFQRALQSNPTLEGRVTVKFLISRDGSVGYASDGGSDIPDAGVRQCVVSSFTNLSFPAPDSGVVTVVYPIAFSPQ